MTVPQFIRAPLLRLARKLGYAVFKVDRDKPLYGVVLPEADYSPWNNDKQFLEAYEAIRSNTLVDVLRCYELWSLVGMVAHCGGSLIEVGVWKGGTGALIAKRAWSCGIPDAVYLCDTFSGVAKASERDSVYVGGEHADTSIEVVTTLLRDLGLVNAEVLPGLFPEVSGAALEHLTFRFCHIDVDVYESAKDAFEWVWDRLVVGGVVVFDDYGFKSTPGVTRFVDEQSKSTDRVTVHNLNGHAVVVRTR